MLNANYMAAKLQQSQSQSQAQAQDGSGGVGYDVLFRGSNGQCAHEFIL
jgi:hypothetical protein